MEPYLPDWIHPYLMVLHLVIMFQNVMMLPAQFHYRLLLMHNPRAKKRRFLLNMFVAGLFSTFLAGYLGLAMVATMSNGHDYYMQRFAPVAGWHTDSDGGTFIYMVTMVSIVSF